MIVVAEFHVNHCCHPLHLLEFNHPMMLMRAVSRHSMTSLQALGHVAMMGMANPPLQDHHLPIIL